MNNEATLREKAREAIQSGKLPATKPSRTWGGPGSGTECSVCGEPVKPDQMELEIEYRPNGGTPASTITTSTSGASPRGSAKAQTILPRARSSRTIHVTRHHRRHDWRPQRGRPIEHQGEPLQLDRKRALTA